MGVRCQSGAIAATEFLCYRGARGLGGWKGRIKSCEVEGTGCLNSNPEQLAAWATGEPWASHSLSSQGCYEATVGVTRPRGMLCNVEEGQGTSVLRHTA